VPRVNLLKQFKADGVWVLRPIPRKASGGYDWSALPDGHYFIEWYEAGKRRRETAGLTVAQAQEAQRRKRHELEGRKLGVPGYDPPSQAPRAQPLASAVTQYLEHVETLKKPNTYRKYEAVLRRFSRFFEGRTLDAIPVSDLNDYVVHLKRDAGMSANTVLHNTIIIAQFFKRQGRGGITRLLDLPERITTLPKEYRQEELDKFLKACDSSERALFYTFLLTGFREQEVMYLFWSDINLDLRTIRVTAKPQHGFYAKRWEEREVPIPLHLIEILEKHPRRESCQFVFPSPTGNREQHMLDRCKAVAKRAGLNAKQFDLKTFRSTYATRMLRAGFDVRTVQHWMGHKSLETTMRYLVPATEVHAKLDQIDIPGLDEIRPRNSGPPRSGHKAPASEESRSKVRRKSS
jgi:integrase/recombinase XerD